MLFKLPFEEDDMKRQAIMRMLKSIMRKPFPCFLETAEVLTCEERRFAF